MSSSIQFQNDASRMLLAARYKNEEFVPVNLAPHYQPHFGKSMYVSVNGIAAWIPLDGQTYFVPQTFADAIAQKRKQADLHELRLGALSDVTRNFEQNAGDIKFF